MVADSSITCPICGSDEVGEPKRSRAAFAWSFLLLGFPLPFLTKRRHCFNCGEDFKSNKKSGDGVSESTIEET